jgi:hypothetical protein
MLTINATQIGGLLRGINVMMKLEFLSIFSRARAFRTVRHTVKAPLTVVCNYSVNSWMHTAHMALSLSLVHNPLFAKV